MVVGGGYQVFVIGLLQYQYPSVRVCYGCSVELKTSGQIPGPTNVLIIMSGDKLFYYDIMIYTQTGKVKQNNWCLMNFTLNKSEFRDVIKLRYGWEFNDIPTVCVSCYDFYAWGIYYTAAQRNSRSRG